jgi:hypothetical protein
VPRIDAPEGRIKKIERSREGKVWVCRRLRQKKKRPSGHRGVHLPDHKTGRRHLYVR